MLLSGWCIIIVIHVICVHKHTRENTISSFPGGTCYSTLSQASKQTSSFGKNQHDGYFFSFCKDLCRGQGHIRRSCVHLASFVRNQGRGQRQVHTETAICNEPGFPKEQASSSCSLTSSIPRQIKTTQLLPLPTATLRALRAPLNLMAGPSTSVCYTATLRAARGPGSVEAGLLSGDRDTTHFMPFVSFTNSG